MSKIKADSPTAGRAELSAAITRSLNAVSEAGDIASRHGFEGTQEDCDQLFIELLRVQSSLWNFRHRAFRALPPEADWLQLEFPGG